MVWLSREQLVVLPATSVCAAWNGYLQRFWEDLIHKVNMDYVMNHFEWAKGGCRRSVKSKDVAAKWVAIFQAADLPNMLCIISHILSIPVSTGYVERIFSRMASKWSDCRNRCSVELMRSELLVTLNFEQFRDFITLFWKTSSCAMQQGVTWSTGGKKYTQWQVRVVRQWRWTGFFSCFIVT